MQKCRNCIKLYGASFYFLIQNLLNFDHLIFSWFIKETFKYASKGPKDITFKKSTIDDLIKKQYTEQQK